MLEIRGNIWDYHDKGEWIVITVNGSLKNNGEAVMGRGVAKEVKDKFRSLPIQLGRAIKSLGNRLYISPLCKLFTFPVKHKWDEKADLVLIEYSARELIRAVNMGELKAVYMVRPGCGNGGLEWKEVKKVLEKYLDDRFIIVEKEG